MKADLDETEGLDESFRSLKAAVFHLHQEGKLLEESQKAIGSTPTQSKDGSPAVSEANFDLNNYTEYTSQKLGTFEVAEEKGNNKEKWNRAFNILKNANAKISSRYHGENYAYSYWLFKDRIYRQKLKR